MSVTQRIAEFTAGIKFSDFPPETVEVARRAILDCAGVALAGTRERCSVMVAEWVRELGGHAGAGLPSGGRTSPPAAALVWGTAAHALDFDDVLLTSLIGHPSVTLVPVVFSLGRQLGASGQKTLEAYLVGLEVAGKIGRAVSRAQCLAGWHATSTIGSLGAAAAAARMLDLDAGRVIMALGIAASMAGGLRQNFGTMTKPLHAGLAARNGVVAAMLASKGLTADATILEAQFGFANVFSGTGGHDLRLVEGIGRDWEACDLTFKQYPCCAGTHRPLDAVLQLRDEYRLEAGQVEAVVCRVDNVTTRVLIHPRPRTGLEAKFSMPYCAAAALLDGKVGLAQFTDQAVAGFGAGDLLEKVAMEGLPGADLPGGYAVVEIRERSGVTHTCRVDNPKGSPGNPLTWSELTAKYRDCAGLVLSPRTVEQTVDLFGALERLPSIVPLLDLLESGH